MSRLTRGGTAEPASRDQILRRERGQGNIHFLCSADHEQDWQPYPVDPYLVLAICVTIQYHETLPSFSFGAQAGNPKLRILEIGCISDFGWTSALRPKTYLIGVCKLKMVYATLRREVIDLIG